MMHIVWLLGVSPGSNLCATLLNIANNDEIKQKVQLTVTATQPHLNWKFCQFNNDQDCTQEAPLSLSGWIGTKLLGGVGGMLKIIPEMLKGSTEIQIQVPWMISSPMHYHCTYEALPNLIDWLSLVLGHTSVHIQYWSLLNHRPILNVIEIFD